MGGYSYVGAAGVRRIKAWVRSLVPTKLSQLTNDPGYITSAGVTGVKGGAEASYRTGDVVLTPVNIGAAASSHKHAASDLTSGALPVERGGTGASTAAAARAALGVGDLPVYGMSQAWAGNQEALVEALPSRPCAAASADGYLLRFDADASTDSY